MIRKRKDKVIDAEIVLLLHLCYKKGDNINAVTLLFFTRNLISLQCDQFLAGVLVCGWQQAYFFCLCVHALLLPGAFSFGLHAR